MATIKLNIKSLAGDKISGASVNITMPNSPVLVSKLSDADGKLSVSGIGVGITTVKVSANTFSDNAFNVKIAKEDDIVDKDVVMLSAQTAEQAVVKPVDTITKAVTGIVDSYVSTAAPTNIDEAKANYKSLLANIDSQKSVIHNALTTGALAVLQVQASNLIYTAKNELQKSMDYYAGIRSKLNPFGSWVQFRDWCECSSMIAGIYILRKNLVAYVNSIMEKVKTTL